MTESLKILNLPMNACNNEIKKQFRRLSLTYHPDKHLLMLGITREEATAHVQMLNNAGEFLRAQ
jgi:DnaJ-class molecular chaperone